MEKTTEQPTPQQTKYLGYLLSRAHERGVPHLPIASLSRSQVSDWIDYLKPIVEKEQEPKGSPPSFTSSRERLPPSYRPPWRELPDADDHEHLVGTIRRSDGLEQCICVSCGVSA